MEYLKDVILRYYEKILHIQVNGVQFWLSTFFKIFIAFIQLKMTFNHKTYNGAKTFPVSFSFDTFFS